MSLIDSSRVESAIQRLSVLDASARPRWGKMDALAMVEHLSNSMEIALGLRQARAVAPSWIAPLLWRLGSLALPIPPGMPSTPEFLAVRGESFEPARAELGRLLRRFHRDALADPAAIHVHPVFGALNRLQWAELQDRHLAHHFKQFRL
jgi:hypothetical protein